jgi:hypothetical protein
MILDVDDYEFARARREAPMRMRSLLAGSRGKIARDLNSTSRRTQSTM